MKRRRLVSLLGATTLPVVGCLGRSGTAGTETPSQTEERTSTSTVTATHPDTVSGSQSPAKTLALGETYESGDGTTVTVDEVHVRKLVRSTSAGGSPTHIDVACSEAYQYVVVAADVTGVADSSSLTDGRLGVVVDGTRHPGTEQHLIRANPPGSNDRTGRPAVPVPVADAAEAAVVLLRDDAPPVHWRLPSEQVALLGRSPAFTIGSFETPDSVAQGASFEVTFTVPNAGDRDGRFVAELGAGPVSDHGEVIVEVPAGTERTRTETLRPYYSDGVEELNVSLDWGCGRLSRTISVTH